MLSDKPLRDALTATVVGLRAQASNSEITGTSDETSVEHLLWMLDHLLDNMEIFPVDKTSRWIGFVQGVLAANGILNTKAERDRTRPLFHKAYEEMGIDVPQTINRLVTKR